MLRGWVSQYKVVSEFFVGDLYPLRFFLLLEMRVPHVRIGQHPILEYDEVRRGVIKNCDNLCRTIGLEMAAATALLRKDERSSYRTSNSFICQIQKSYRTGLGICQP